MKGATLKDTAAGQDDGERAVLARFLDGEDVLVDADYETPLEVQLARAGQEIKYPTFELSPPSCGGHPRVRTRLFIPGRFFTLEKEVQNLIRGSGFIEANAWVAAAVCRLSPGLQFTYGILAPATRARAHEGKEVVFCCSTSDFLARETPFGARRGDIQKHVAQFLPVYGGFEARYAFLGMRYT